MVPNILQTRNCGMGSCGVGLDTDGQGHMSGQRSGGENKQAKANAGYWDPPDGRFYFWKFLSMVLGGTGSAWSSL